MREKRIKDVLSVCATLVLAMFLAFGTAFASVARADGATASGATAVSGDAVADPSTIWDWEGLIKDSTVNVGRIWTDKTVSTGNMTKDNITVEKAENGVFLTALTALSSTSNLSSTSTTPLDIVLVLDMSSSMTQDMGSTTKLAALKSAANAFVDTIAEQNESIAGEKNQHKVAVVSFNSTATVNQAMTTCAGTAASDIKGVTSGLQTSQHTRSDLALQNAQSVLTSSKSDGRKQIVVFFTDGTPTTSGSFDSGIARDAVAAAKAMKDSGATVYTIGVLKGADPSVDPAGASVTPENKFLHAVSSNYPSATYINGTWTFGTRAKTSDDTNAEFYKTATTAEELAQIFADISKEITEGTGYPTATEEGYASTSGYITFNDQLGDYMQVTDLSKLVYDRKVYTSTGKSTYRTTNGSIDTYTFSGEVDSGAAKGNLNDLVITVTHSDDVATGDLVRMRIPASLIPLRHFNVDLTKPSMGVDETKPIALFYTTALKEGVADLLANPDATMAAYIAANTDATTGKVNFYANKWNGGALGDATAVFSPSSANKYYYFTEDTPIYSDGDCTQRATSIESDKTYYYKHEYYRNGYNKPVLASEVRKFPGDKAAAFAGSIGTDANGACYFKAGTARLVYINQLHKSKESNETGTAADVLNPKWNNETSVAAATTITAYLGNNGKLSVEKPATLEVSKTVEVGEGYKLDDFTDTSFAFELSIPDAAGKTFNAQVLGADGKIAGDAFKLTFDAQGKTEHSIKHGEKLQVFGLSAGWAYTVSEKDADTFKQTATGETGTFAAGQTAQASFTNTYEPDSVPYDAVADLGVYKELTGREWTDSDEFTFKLEALTEGAPMPQKTSVGVTKADVVENGQAPVTFGDITYTKPGTYQYQVSEENTGQTIAGVKYADNVAKFTVTVTDLDENGTHTGKLVATVELTSGSASFTNTYTTTDAEYDTAGFGLSKTLAGREWKDSDEFGFALEAVTEGAPMPAATSVSVTKANAAAFDFGTITFKQPGTYEYQVKETAGDLGGVAYSTNVSKFKVTVVDDGEGKLVATSELTSGSAAFTNTYTTTKTEYDTADAGFAKALTGRDWVDGDSFDFTLAAVTEGAPMPASTTATVTKADVVDGRAPFSFGSITYTEPGTYVYQVIEDVGELPGVTYSTNTATLTVTVTDDGEGHLTASANAENVTFTNAYEASLSYTAAGGLNVAKTLTGRDMANGQFTITVAAADEDSAEALGIPQSGLAISVPAAADGEQVLVNVFSGRDVIFTQDDAGKTYTLKVSEVDDAQSGFTYDAAERTVTIAVTDDPAAGALTATTTVSGGAQGEQTFVYTKEGAAGGKVAVVLFANSYFASTDNPGGAAAQLSATKTLTGRDLAAGEFSFGVRLAGTEDDLLTAANDAAGKVDLGTLSYTTDSLAELVAQGKAAKTGTTWTISYVAYEKTDGLAERGVTAQTQPIAFTVTVVDNGDGSLTATANLPAGGLAFVNSYAAGTARIDVSGIKTLAYAENLTPDDITGKFTFTITSDDQAAPLPTSATATNDANGNVDFGTITFTLDDLNRALGTTAETKATEQKTEAKADANAQVKTEATSDAATDAEKKLDDADELVVVKTVADEYATDEYAVDALTLGEDELAPVVEDVVVEPSDQLVDATAAQSEAEPLVLLGTPVVSDAPVSGNAGAAENASAAQPAAFVRTRSVFKAASLTVTKLSAENQIADAVAAVSEGGSAADGVVVTSNGSANEVVPTAEVDPAEATPTPRSYTFVYTVSESGSVHGVTNDAEVKTVSIKVTDDGLGNLTAELLGEEGKPAFSFTNAYDVEPVTTSVTDQVDVTKQLTGRDMADGEFGFELLDGQDVVATGANAADGTVTLSALTYTEPGTHSYTLREVDGGSTKDGVTYDGTVYQVTTTVADNGQGELVATHQVAGASDVVFKNTYEAKPTSVVIGASKVLKGKTLKDGQFTFKLTGEGIELEAKNKADGSVTFRAIEFKTPGTYGFDVYEVNDGQANVTYDGAKHHVVVTVEDDGLGSLVAKVTGAEAFSLTFTNIYTEPSTPTQPKTPGTTTTTTTGTTTTTTASSGKSGTTPKTGDEATWAVTVLLGAAALAALAVALWFKRVQK